MPGAKCGDFGGLNAVGDPCKRDVKPGMTRCNLHGGASPASKIKAEQAMALLRMPAIETLYRIVEQAERNTCTSCGYPTGDTDEKRMLVRACQTILDRAGMGPHATLELTTQSDGPMNFDLLTLEERAELLELIARMKALKATLRARQMGELANPQLSAAPVIDGTVVGTSASVDSH